MVKSLILKEKLLAYFLLVQKWGAVKRHLCRKTSPQAKIVPVNNQKNANVIESGPEARIVPSDSVKQESCQPIFYHGKPSIWRTAIAAICGMNIVNRPYVSKH